MSAEHEAPAARGGAPTPRRAAREGSRRRRRGGLLAFLAASALPVAGVVVFLLQPEERREALLDRIPPGVGGRALVAAACFGVLVLLARVALPAFHGASGALVGLRERFRRRGPVLRVLLFPVEALLAVLWLLVQVLFAVDAFLILLAALLALLLVVRIGVPGFLPDILPRFAG